MNIESIELLKSLLEAASAGPWKSYVEGRDHTSGSNFIKTGNPEYDIEFLNLRQADQDFIVAARNILPQLMEEFLRMKSLLSEDEI